MTEQDWERLGELLNKIVHAKGAWQDKKAELVLRMEAECADASFEEIIGWFGGDVGDTVKA